jgi:hypothetical protein
VVSRRGPAMRGAGRALATAAGLAALIALAGLSLGRIYNGPLLVQLVAGAAAGSVVLSTALRRAPAWLVAPVSVTALVGYGAWALAVSAPAAGITGAPREIALDAARNAVPRLLTALIPVEAQPDTVLAPVVLAWLAGLAAAELAGRVARPALALLPPVLLYAGALVLVGPNAPTVAWHALAFAALAAAVLVVAAPPAGRGPAPRTRAPVVLRLRTGIGYAVGLALVLAVVAALAPVVAQRVARTPTDPRRYVQPPSLDVLDENPLIRLSGWAAEPDQPLFAVTVVRGPDAPTADGATVGAPDDGEDPDAGEEPAGEGGGEEAVAAYDTRLRLAVLSDWDGVTWHIDTDYRNAGRVLPPPAAPPGLPPTEEVAPPLTITERLTVAQLRGRLLPAVAAPTRVDGVRVAYDRTTGTLLHAQPLRPGVAYTVTSRNPSVDVALLPAADVPSGEAVARYLAVGDTVPPDLSRLADQVSAGETSPYLRALALESFLAEHYRLAADAPSGHAYPNLRFFLFDDPRAGGQRGTSEQFASAFAALGRLMGLPTRVVVGFRTPRGGGAVTAGDALAWPEVLFDEVGWVAFNPLPEPDTPPQPLEEEFLPRPPPSSEPPTSVEPPEPETESAAPTVAAPAAPGRAGPAAGQIVTGVGGGLLVALVLALLTVAVLRSSVRRRRLHGGSPPQRVLGAWGEILDALTLAGAPPSRDLAAAEVAVHARTVAGRTAGRRHARHPRPAAPALDDLAAKVNTVGFAGPVAGADDLAAASATAAAVEYTRALRGRQPWWRRLWWLFDPRPLRRRP